MNTNLTAREATSAMCMIHARTEKDYGIMAFSNGLMALDISPKHRLDEIMKKTEGLNFSSTNISAPIEVATANKIAVDAFIIYTDNEVNYGIHPKIALDKYRQATGKNAKLIIAATTSTGFTVADPKDIGMLDCVGFSADIGSVISNFIRE